MLISQPRDSARVIHLPGRDWAILIDPASGAAHNALIGFAVYPGGSAPRGHVHPESEEYLYIVAGSGRLVSPENTVDLKPGMAVMIPAGLEHSTVADDDEPLEFVVFFSPPVAPGSWEPQPGES